MTMRRSSTAPGSASRRAGERRACSVVQNWSWSGGGSGSEERQARPGTGVVRWYLRTLRGVRGLATTGAVVEECKWRLAGCTPTPRPVRLTPHAMRGWPRVGHSCVFVGTGGTPFRDVTASRAACSRARKGGGPGGAHRARARAAPAKKRRPEPGTRMIAARSRGFGRGAAIVVTAGGAESLLGHADAVRTFRAAATAPMQATIICFESGRSRLAVLPYGSE